MQNARFFEERVSGTTDHVDRQAFGEMLSLAGPATATTFVVERADRIARDLVVSEVLLKAAREAGITIFDAAAEMDLTADVDPARVLIRQIFGALAQFEKSSMVKKLRAARDRMRAEQGRCEGPKPLEDTPAGLAVVKQIVDLRNRGFSLGNIKSELESKGILSPSGNAVWSRSSIDNILWRVEAGFPITPPDPRIFEPTSGIV